MAEGDQAPAAATQGDSVTISRADLVTLQGGYKLLNSLWDHPEHGAAVKRAAKAIDPKLRIPEIDVAEPLLKPINERLDAMTEENKTLREQMAADKTAREDDKALSDLKTRLADAQKKHRLTDEGMAEVMKIMKDRNVADPEIAARYVVSEIEHPAQSISGSNFGPQSANIFDMDGSSKDDDIKSLHKDPVKWLDQVVPKIMAETDQEQAA